MAASLRLPPHPAAAQLSLFAKEACTQKAPWLQACFSVVRLWCSREVKRLSARKESFSMERRGCGRGRGMAFHPPLFLTGRSRGLTYCFPILGESAKSFPVVDARRRPGRNQPHSLGARDSRSARFLCPPGIPLRTRLSLGGRSPRSTLGPGMEGPAVSFCCQAQACDAPDSPKPLPARGCCPHPQVPAVEAQAGRLSASLSAPERRRCALGECGADRAPSGKRVQGLRAGRLAPCFERVTAASVLPGRSGACWAKASS